MRTYFTINPNEYNIYWKHFDGSSKLPNVTGNPELQKALQECVSNGNSGAHYLDISSSNALKNWLESQEPVGSCGHYFASHDIDSDFAGTRNMEESLDILINGVDDFVKSIIDQSKKIESEYTGLSAKDISVKRDVEGNFLDVGIHMTGEPDPFYSSDTEYIPDKCLTLDITCGYSGSTDFKYVLENVSKVLSAVNILENSGYRVKITLWWTNYTDSDVPNLMLRYNIKNFRDRLNLHRIVGAIHPGFLRRCEFRIQELLGSGCYGYGASGQYKDNSYGLQTILLNENPGSTDNIIKKIKDMSYA